MRRQSHDCRFLVLWWVGGLTFLGAVVLLRFGSPLIDGSPSIEQLAQLLFASLDQLLPIVTLNQAHDALIFGNSSANPPVDPQPFGVLVYFYAHKLAGWILGSFLVAGFAGLTQRN